MLLHLLQWLAFGLTVLSAVMAINTYDLRFEPHKSQSSGTLQVELLGFWTALCIASIVSVIVTDRLI